MRCACELVHTRKVGPISAHLTEARKSFVVVVVVVSVVASATMSAA